MVVGMLKNAAVLLALAYIYDLVFLRHELTGSRLRLVLLGLGIGLAGIVVMLSHWSIEPGLIFDTRSVLLGVSGLFFGTIPTVVAMVIVGLFRYLQGGAGMWTGVFVALVSGYVGLAWRARRKKELGTISWRELLLVGFIIHLGMMVCFAIFPGTRSPALLLLIAGPVLLLYPVVFAAMGKLMAQRLRREEITRLVQESESRYRSLFENNHTVMFIIDPTDGRIVDANPRAETYYGWTREQLKKMWIADINTLPPEEVREEMRLAAEGQRHHFNFRHRKADGSVRDVEVFSGPITIDGKERLYSIVHDVTSRRQSEEALLKAEREVRTLLQIAEESRVALQESLEQQRKLAQAVEQSPASVVITDLEGRIEYVNRRFSEVTGYALAEVRGLNPRILQSGETSPEQYAELWSTITSGREWRGEFVNRAKDGHLYRERAVISPLFGPSGEIVQYLAVKENITSERLMQEQLRQAQKMEAVGRLAGGVAHDFNNMLQAILGYADLALEEASRGSPLRENLVEIRAAAMRSANLARQLLAFARSQPIAPQIIDLNDSVSSMLKMLQRLIGEDIQLEWRPAADLWKVCIDPGQVDQILANLSVNARDAMPSGGSLILRTANISVGEMLPGDYGQSGPGDYVQLVVSDTGLGMNAEVLHHLFEPFFTTKAEGKGTGLGLATIYGIVQQNGGFLRVQSIPGKGSSFSVFLPRIQGEATESAKAGAPERSLSGTESILLVEDEVPLIRLAEMALTRKGYKVSAFSDPAKALAHLDQGERSYDLLITDVVMPGLNGREVREAVELRIPGIRTLFISGYTSDIIAQHGIDGDGMHFLAKPFASRTLLEKVRQVFDGTREVE